MEKIQKKKKPIIKVLNNLNLMILVSITIFAFTYLFLMIMSYCLKIPNNTFINFNYITVGFYNSWVIYSVFGNINSIFITNIYKFHLNKYTRFESFLGICYILVAYNIVISMLGSIKFNYLAKNFGFEFNFSNYLYNLLMLIFLSLVVFNIVMWIMKLIQKKIKHVWLVVVGWIITFIVAVSSIIFIFFIIDFKRVQNNFSGFSKQIFLQLNNFYEHTFNFYSKAFNYVNFTLTMFTLIIIMLWFLYGKFKKYDRITFI